MRMGAVSQPGLGARHVLFFMPLIPNPTPYLSQDPISSEGDSPLPAEGILVVGGGKEEWNWALRLHVL